MNLDERIKDFFDNNLEDIFGSIGILGAQVTLLCIVIDLIFGTNWSAPFAVGFWLFYLASIVITFIVAVFIHDFYVAFLSWWLDDLLDVLKTRKLKQSEKTSPNKRARGHKE